ncbi:hypothetical protein BB559_001691 [Furculomyces boomerangus]|uniref:Uncharacterized protein n=1 Tax=Furculomyces boomerangus TaxID=61424 RepID=A0A2T9Z146_9FUNG|nr:hypothetical protein BB559_001691 [Furculomyces boomerangus]
MGLDKLSKTRTPRDAFYGIQNKKEKRAKKEIEEMRNRGVLTSSVKREIEEKHIKKLVEYKKKSKVKDRGLIVGSAKFKDGVLHVSKKQIEKNTGDKKRGRR